mmetsp:Transcript_90632/g.151627  ORF Transcript_90632/g.151627 Transcript_90632/m.151627 type:complete len:774 (-) Transcript_90632:202-2523(-)
MGRAALREHMLLGARARATYLGRQRGTRNFGRMVSDAGHKGKAAKGRLLALLGWGSCPETKGSRSDCLGFGFAASGPSLLVEGLEGRHHRRRRLLLALLGLQHAQPLPLHGLLVLQRDRRVLLHDGPELVAGQRLHLHELLHSGIHGGHVVADQAQGPVVARRGNLLHVPVNGRGHLLRHLIAGHHAHDHVLLLPALQRPGADVRHAELRDHGLGHAGHLLQVPAGPGGDLGVPEEDLLGGAPPEGAHDAGLHLALGDQRRVVAGDEPRQPAGLAAGDQGDLLHGVVPGGQGGAEGVPHLVVGDQGLGLAVADGVAGQTRDDAVDGVVNLQAGDGLLVPAPREDGGLVEQVAQVRPGEAGGPHGDGVDGDVGVQRLVRGVHAEDRLAPADVGRVDSRLPVEPPWTQQRRVQDVRAVGGGEHDHAGVALEPVHLCQDLVQGLLTLVIPLADPGATGAPHGIDLIDEDEARGVLTGLLEEIANTAGTDTDEHLHELGPGAVEERHPSLASDGLGQQCLTSPRGAGQEHPLGDLRPHGGVLLGGLQEFHNLHQVLLGLVNPCHVLERHAGVGLHLEPRLCLPQPEPGLAPAPHPALRPAREEEQPPEQQQRERQVGDDAREVRGGVGPGHADGHALLRHDAQQLGLVGGGDLDLDELGAVAQLRADEQRVKGGAVGGEAHLLHPVQVQVLQESGVGHPPAHHHPVVNPGTLVLQGGRTGRLDGPGLLLHDRGRRVVVGREGRGLAQQSSTGDGGGPGGVGLGRGWSGLDAVHGSAE